MRLLTDSCRIAAETTVILNVFQLSSTDPSVYFRNVLNPGHSTSYDTTSPVSAGARDARNPKPYRKQIFEDISTIQKL